MDQGTKSASSGGIEEKGSRVSCDTVIKRVKILYRGNEADSHWEAYFLTDTGQWIKVHLTKFGYQILYEADPDRTGVMIGSNNNPSSVITDEFNRIITFGDVLSATQKILQEHGMWRGGVSVMDYEKSYNCQNFVIELVCRLNLRDRFLGALLDKHQRDAFGTTL